MSRYIQHAGHITTEAATGPLVREACKCGRSVIVLAGTKPGPCRHPRWARCCECGVRVDCYDDGRPVACEACQEPQPMRPRSV